MWYDLLDKNLRFIGEVDFVVPETRTKYSPEDDEIIEVDGNYYRWANQEFAFITMKRPNTEVKAHQINKDKTKCR